MRTNESHLEPKHELTAESKPELGKPTTEMPEHREHAEQKPEHSYYLPCPRSEELQLILQITHPSLHHSRRLAKYTAMEPVAGG